MKPSILGCLWIAVVAAGLVPGAQLVAQVEPPPLPVGQNDLVRVEGHGEGGELEIVVGPVTLPPEGAHLRLPIQMVTLPVGGWLHAFDWEMRDGAGRKLPDELLHHVNLIDPDARELFAPVSRRVMAAGRETGRQHVPRLLGYPLEAGTRLLISSMFDNPTGAAVEDAYLHVRLSYTAAKGRLIPPRTVYPFYLDVMGLVSGNKDFPLPPGRTVMAWEGSPAIDARILGIGGHVHDYATALRLVDVTAGRVIWEAEPEVDEEGRVVAVPTGRLWWRGGVRIHRDHVYRIEVEYLNPLDVPAPDGGMGAIGGVVWAASDAAWPPLDRENVAYAVDLRYTLEKPHREGGHGHGAHGHGQPGHEASGREQPGREQPGHEQPGREHDAHGSGPH